MSANIRNSRLMAIVATLAPIVFADARAQANSRGTEAALMPRTYEVLVVGYRDPNVTFEKTKQEWEAIRANKLSFLDTVELASIQKLTACGDTIDDDPDKPGAAEAYWRCARPVIENMPDRQGYMQGVVERVEEVLSQSYTKHRYADGAFVYDDDGRKVLDTVRFPPRAYLIYNRIDDVLKPRIACYLHEATKSC